MRGGTAGTGKSWDVPGAPVCAEPRSWPDCGDNVAAVIGRGIACVASTVVPLREPGVDWIREGLADTQQAIQSQTQNKLASITCDRSELDI